MHVKRSQQYPNFESASNASPNPCNNVTLTILTLGLVEKQVEMKYITSSRARNFAPLS